MSYRLHKYSITLKRLQCGLPANMQRWVTDWKDVNCKRCRNLAVRAEKKPYVKKIQEWNK